MKQLRNDSTDSPEMPRASSPAEFPGQVLDKNPGLEILRKKVLLLPQQNQVYSLGPTALDICIQIAGIALEILVGIKLGRVQVDADSHPVTFKACLPDQRQVAFMKTSECWNKADTKG
jgi:hypothetical protein